MINASLDREEFLVPLIELFFLDLLIGKGFDNADTEQAVLNACVQLADLLARIPKACAHLAIEDCQHGNTAKISNLAYMTPFLSMLCARIVLGEPIRLTSLIGLCVIVCGILIQLKKTKNEETLLPSDPK